jgi:hypothetical protein
MKNLKKYFTSKNPYENLEFIWGIKSGDCLSPELDLYTLNDFDIIYNKKENKYMFGVETIYQFKDGLSEEKEYLESILNQFTKWMENNNYDTNNYINLWDVFTYRFEDKKFDSIQQLYAYFKLLVTGFINQRDNILKEMKLFAKETASSEEKASKFLQKVGILDEEGNLKPPYDKVFEKWISPTEEALEHNKMVSDLV